MYAAAGSLYHTVSSDGVTFSFSASLGPQASASYDPALVVVSSSAKKPLLVLLFASAASSTLTASVLSSSSKTFATFSGVPVANNVGGVVDAVYQPSQQQLVVAYVSTQSTTPAGYYLGYTITAVVRSGRLVWAPEPLLIQQSSGQQASWQTGTARTLHCRTPHAAQPSPSR